MILGLDISTAIVGAALLDNRELTLSTHWDISKSQTLFEKAAEYWKEAIRLAPLNYSEAQNWLQTTGR